MGIVDELHEEKLREFRTMPFALPYLCNQSELYPRGDRIAPKFQVKVDIPMGVWKSVLISKKCY